MDRARKSYLFAGVSVLFWSTIPTIFKIGLGELDVLILLAIATYTSALALFLILMATGNIKLFLLNTRKDFLMSSLLGLINPFIYYIILLKAYRLLPGQVAQPLNMIWPIILVFLSVPLLGQRIPAKSFLALFISFAGVYVIASQGNPLHPGKSDPAGVLLATGSSLFWALYFILNMRDKREESVKLFTNFLFASIYITIALAFSGKSLSGISLRGTGAAIYVGLFEMGLTFFFWLKALQLAETTDKVSSLVYLSPFISLLFLYFILNEHVYYTTPAGLALIIAGLYIQSRRNKPVI
ncbi:MAG TPA: DMT family transporter [Bacteroidales bacterium]|nr:DMT family transporter [Bacteroidales bacterium]